MQLVPTYRRPKPCMQRPYSNEVDDQIENRIDLADGKRKAIGIELLLAKINECKWRERTKRWIIVGGWKERKNVAKATVSQGDDPSLKEDVDNHDFLAQ